MFEQPGSLVAHFSAHQRLLTLEALALDSLRKSLKRFSGSSSETDVICTTVITKDSLLLLEGTAILFQAELYKNNHFKRLITFNISNQSKQVKCSNGKHIGFSLRGGNKSNIASYLSIKAPSTNIFSIFERSNEFLIKNSLIVEVYILRESVS